MKLLTLQEVAERLAVSLPTIRSWVWKRKIEVVKIGRCVRIREEVIENLIARSTLPPMTSRLTGQQAPWYHVPTGGDDPNGSD